MNELLLAAFAVGGGVVAGGLLYLALRRRAPRPEEPLPLEVLSVETFVAAPVAESGPEDHPFSLVQAAPPPVRPAPARGVRPTYDPDALPELSESPIPTEWARRQVGPLEGGRMKGVCSGCGTSLSVSAARPLRIACPVCGRTRLLAA